MTELDTHPNEAPAPTETRPHGCLTAFLVGVITSVIGVAGFIWLNTVYQPPLALYGGLAAATSLGLLVVFAPVVIFLRQPRFGLWRGIALMLALAGGYVLLLGALQTLDVALHFVDIPASLPPWIGLAYSGAILVIVRKHWRFASPASLVWLAVGTGMVASGVWVVYGTLGTLRETLLGILEAASLGLFASLLVTAVFTFEPDVMEEHPFWATLLAGALLSSLLPDLLAVRGYWVQGTYLFGALAVFAFVASALSVASQRGWLAPFAAMFVAFLLPFILTEGLEGDWMLDEMAPAWAPALGIGAALTILLGMALLVAVKWLPRLERWPLIPAIGSGLTFVMIIVLYLTLGEPGLKPEVFFAVMADQADTSAAQDIASREERVTYVYDTLTRHALDTQADLRDFLDAHGAVYTPYYLVNGLEIETYNPFLRWQIARRADVARVLNSPHARPLPRTFKSGINVIPATVTSPELAWGVDASDAEVVWDTLGITGEGIIVGQADSGVDWMHPALHDQYMGSDGNHDYTWFDPWESTTEPTDSGGHGTHTLGTVLGKGGIGMAPGAQWIACRNLARNLGNPAYYLDCMQFLFAPFPQNGDPLTEGDPLRGAHVTNNSWGCPPEEGCDGLTLPIATQHLRDAGQMMVVSAGNSGPTCNTVDSPALADSVLSVGAYLQGGDATSFSSRGPVEVDGSDRTKPDISAPGMNILSSVPGGGYGTSAGTSMAGPHVTGLVALLWSANPDLIGDIDATEQIIFATADEHTTSDQCGPGSADPNNVYGYGLMDADQAVEAALGSN